MAASRSPNYPRRLRAIAWASVAAAMLATLVLVADFLYPRIDASHRHFEAGFEDGFARGSVAYFEEQHFFLVRLPNGEFRAFHDLDLRQHLMPLPPGRSTPCRLEWIPPEEVAQRAGSFGYDHPEDLFREPCHLSTFTIEGKRIYGPSPADLPEFRVTVKGFVTVDLSQATCFSHTDKRRRDCLPKR
jgi:hypothetical protein